MRQFTTGHLFFTVIIFLFSLGCCCAFGVNALYFHYPGNVYYPKEAPWIFCILCLIYLGFYILWGKEASATKRAKHLLYLFLVMALIIVGCMAIQYTPFPPIDQTVLAWHERMCIKFQTLIYWANSHPTLYQTMEALYESIAPQMTYLPLLLILFGHFKRLHEYYFLLITSALLGYMFYYFFPTTAPASIIDSPYFTVSQRATGLKFYQIHAHIQPSTLEGGMIALPSYHVIWAWLCAFMIREWRLAFILLCILNTGVVISCVVLGWHYLPDIVGSLLILCIVHYLYSKYYPIIGTEKASISFNTKANRHPACAKRF